MQANERLQGELQNQNALVDKLEASKHVVDCKYADLVKTKQSMVSTAVQVNKNHWSFSCATQTPIKVSYDQQVQADLVEHVP